MFMVMRSKILSLLLVIGFNQNIEGRKQCKATVTTVSGSQIPNGQICSGDLVFEDNFGTFDPKKWGRENTLSGGGNGEFQWYTTSEQNSFTSSGALHLKPTFLADDYGNDFLYYGTLDLGSKCTDSFSNGCKRTGTKAKILNPIKSAKLTTKDSFSFKYGILEVRAMLPSGDWLWPAIWMFPKDSAYGSWPASGEIDLVEARGNKIILDNQGKNVGAQQESSTLHWGPNPNFNRYYLTHYEKNNSSGFDNAYHTYTFHWTAEYITFSVDGSEIGKVNPPSGGFWELGHLSDSGAQNPWKTRMGPFDQEFYIILNLAIGGTNGFFPDNANYGTVTKPWRTGEDNGVTKFWEARESWDPTWNRQDPYSKSHFKIDYVRVWAL